MCHDPTLTFGDKLRAHNQPLPVAEKKGSSAAAAAAAAGTDGTAMDVQAEPATDAAVPASAAAAGGADVDGGDADADDGAGAGDDMDDTGAASPPPAGADGAAAAAKRGRYNLFAVTEEWPTSRALDVHVRGQDRIAWSRC